MNRADLIERVSKKGQMNRGRAELLVDTSSTAWSALCGKARRSKFVDSGPSRFEATGHTRAKSSTGQIVEVKPKRLPHFKVSNELAARIDLRRGRKPAATGATALVTQARL